MGSDDHNWAPYVNLCVTAAPLESARSQRGREIDGAPSKDDTISCRQSAKDEGTMSLYEDFWWASQFAGRDTRRAAKYFPERQTSGFVNVDVVPPEEYTTFNLVLRLAQRSSVRGSNVAVWAHSRTLEGGRAKGVQPSAADLDLTVEVAPLAFVSLALQAKKYAPTSSSSLAYGRWDKDRPRRLVAWAAKHGFSPGLLLYNTNKAPFTGFDGRTTPIFGGCCQPDKECVGAISPPSPAPPTSLTPMAISVVPDVMKVPQINSEVNAPATSQRDLTLTPADVQGTAAPLECLFCPKWGGLPKTSTPPTRAQQMLGDGPDAVAELEDDPDFSLAIGMTSEQRDAWRAPEDLR